ncbi:MAG: DUF6494 family protein [Rhodospirillales bacterium]|nr:DUF6494 family protein [Rhodospirillales bacterium]MCY4002808.1 DUF6494 family protein [Rhodospirillales bacterium]MCY4097484.1 DUF6494 family protein [Rhodospirillales bacterium]MDE0371462.1 DUF6494 family protein [Rhodospirillales bacterium]MYE20100.1 hypothetical protein [Rhodospirillales bacterium]
MDEETLNRSLRRFLKTLGVNAQREIETAIRSASTAQRLPDKPLKATAEIHIPDIDFRFELNAVIQFS